MNGAGDALNQSTQPKRFEDPLDRSIGLQMGQMIPANKISKSGKIIERTRKPNARATEIVLGALAERLSVMESSPNADTIHMNRLRELLDELKRSIGKRQPAQEAEEA